MVRSGEGDPAADPRQPAIEIDDPVRPREHPVRPGQRAAQRRAIADPDERDPSLRQDPTERDDDRLVADGRRDRGAVHGDRRQVHAAEAGCDRVQFDAVDRAARRVADRGRRVDRDRARTPGDPEPGIVGRIEERAGPVHRPRDDVARRVRRQVAERDDIAGRRPLILRRDGTGGRHGGRRKSDRSDRDDRGHDERQAASHRPHATRNGRRRPPYEGPAA